MGDRSRAGGRAPPVARAARRGAPATAPRGWGAQAPVSGGTPAGAAMKDARQGGPCAPVAPPGARVVALCFMATLVAYVERTGFNVAFTAAAAQRGLSQADKGTVLSAFYWGYALTQVPGGYLASKLGGQRVLCSSMITLAVVSILTPMTDKVEGSDVGDSPWWLTSVAAARVCVGVVQGVVFPSVHTLLAEWIAPHARSRCVSVAMSGMYLGSAVAMLVAPATVEAIGARGQLQVHAAASVFWLAFFVAAFPHRALPGGIKRDTLPTTAPSANGGSGAKGASVVVRGGAIPWGAMFRSPAVWAIIVNNFGYHYLVYVLVSWQPTYFEEALGVRLAGNKLASSGPYFVMTVCTTVGGLLSDALISRGNSVATARKYINSAGFALSTLALAAVPYVTNPSAAALVIAVAVGAAAIARGGFAVNHMDIAPRYAGVLMGLSNSAGTLAGVVGVKLTGTILHVTHGTWAPVFHVAGAICAAVAVVFAIFGRGEKLFH